MNKKRRKPTVVPVLPKSYAISESALRMTLSAVRIAYLIALAKSSGFLSIAMFFS
jgi:hypothetical protein